MRVNNDCYYISATFILNQEFLKCQDFQDIYKELFFGGRGAHCLLGSVKLVDLNSPCTFSLLSGTKPSPPVPRSHSRACHSITWWRNKSKRVYMCRLCSLIITVTIRLIINAPDVSPWLGTLLPEVITLHPSPI